MIRVTILGATGYSGGELLRILLNHPSAKIQHLTSESSAGEPVNSIHPDLRGRLTRSFESLDAARFAADSDVVFSCYPAYIGIKPNAQFVKAGVKVIDLSGDFRLPTAKLYQTWYRKPHRAPHLLKSAVYGLPELFRQDIVRASLVANPGCYATAAALSMAPLLKPGACVDAKSLIVDAKSGVSGAGKKLEAQYLYSEVDENLKAYSPASHRHQPEMEIALSRVATSPVRVTFTPHLIPMKRGILSVLYATLKKPMKTEDVRALFVKAYEKEPFVRVLPTGELPQTQHVVHTNYCDIGITQDLRARRLIVIAAIDNLVKGAAGQAVQNMNICFHRPETEGLL